jgi:Rod binding domain-containing protein
MDAPAIATALPAATVKKIWAAAQDFEAMALNQFLSPMFDGVDLASGPTGGGEGESAWKPMMIDAVAKQIAHAGGMGIAQPVFRQMIQMQEVKQGSGP